MRHYKATGQGFVELNGRWVDLGRYELPETQQRSHQVIAEWLAARGHRSVMAGYGDLASSVLAMVVVVLPNSENE